MSLTLLLIPLRSISDTFLKSLIRRVQNDNIIYNCISRRSHCEGRAHYNMKSFLYLSSALVLLLSHQSLVNGQANLRDDEVALIIGGMRYCGAGQTCPTKFFNEFDPIQAREACDANTENVQQLRTAELFGCPQFVEEFPVPDYPQDIIFTSGVWLEDEEKVMICGGLDCFAISDGYGNATNKCYWWDPFGSKGWEPAPSMNERRTAHFMGTLPVGNTRRAFAVGGYPTNITTEYFDSSNNRWVVHDDLPSEFNPFDNARGCIVQYEDYLYSIRNDAYSLNLRDFSTQELAETPPILGFQAGTCAIGTRYNDPGVLARRGAFYNIEDDVWQFLEPPPIPFPAEYYTIATYQGSPTIFGMPECPEITYCTTGTAVVQYDSGFDSWSKIGQMQEDRIFHDIITMPRSICAGFITTTTTNQPPPTDPTTSTTTTASTTSTTPTTTTTTTATTSGAGFIISNFILTLLLSAFSFLKH